MSETEEFEVVWEEGSWLFGAREEKILIISRIEFEDRIQ